jgi:hypothetical protein
LLNSILQKWDLQIAVAAEGATEVSFFHLAFCSTRAMSTELFLCKMVLQDRTCMRHGHHCFQILSASEDKTLRAKIT